MSEDESERRNPSSKLAERPEEVNIKLLGDASMVCTQEVGMAQHAVFFVQLSNNMSEF